MKAKSFAKRLLTLSLGMVVAAVLFLNCYGSGIKVGAKAEWDKAKTILVHVPGMADFWPSIFPIGAAYATPFNYVKARKELLNYVRELRKNGIKVYRLDNVLLSGTMDDHGRTIQGEPLYELQDLASKCLHIDTTKVSGKCNVDFEKYKDSIIQTLPPKALLKIVLLNPTIHLIKRDTTTDLDASYSVAPLMDLYFLRDQSITTDKGIVIGKFTNPQRVAENEVIRFAFRKMGIKPVYVIKGNGRLEGGDFYMAGNVAFIGNGLRTNMDAIEQMFNHHAIGVKRVVVVKDCVRNQDEMHLDTYFNILGPKLAVMAADRMRLRGQNIAPRTMSTVDVYELEHGKYVLTEKNKDFQDYLEHDLGYKLIPVPKTDMKKFGPNFLAIAPYKIVGVKGVSKAYRDELKKAGVSAKWLDLNNVIAGFGAAHCTTQVMYRG